MIIEARGDVVSLSGSLEKNLWPAIQAAANLLLRMHPNGILIDASEINHCSDEGARTFLDAMEYIERHNARIVVCHPPAEVQQSIRHVPGVRSRLAIADTTDQGRASLEMASITRRQRPATMRAEIEAGSVRSRLVMIPLLLEESAGLRETIGLALKMGSVGVHDKGREDKAKLIMPLIHFLSVLEIPRSMPLTSPLTEEEERAKKIIQEAVQIAAEAELVCQSTVARTRDAGEQIATQAKDLGIEIIVMSMPPRGNPARDRLEPIIDTVLQRARCEIVVKNFPG